MSNVNTTTCWSTTLFATWKVKGVGILKICEGLIIGIAAELVITVTAGLVVDKAQDLAEEHVEKMLNDILPDNAKKELDKIIKGDKSHVFENTKDALKGAVEGKLPVQMKDGNVMPIEMKVVLKFDPSTGSFDIRKQ